MDGKTYDDFNKDSATYIQNLESDLSQFTLENHALMNTLVLDKIIEFLKFKDIKEFRKVCRRWREVSQTKFWKLSRIKIENTEFLSDGNYELKKGISIQAAEEYNNKFIQSFEKMFPAPGFPFDEIEFKGCISHTLLDYILIQRGSSVITKIYFQLVCEPSNKSIDLCHYLSSNVTTLDIRNHYGAKLKVCLAVLRNIQNLHLENCEILLNGKIAPRELNLQESNSVFYNGEISKFKRFRPDNLEKILINNFVDFSKTKKLCLKGDIWKIDVGDGICNFQDLDIRDIEIIGLRMSQWTTNRLNLKDKICVGNRMEMNTISVTQIVNNEDIHSIPNSAEKLLFSYYKQLITGRSFLFPNIKYLCISINQIDYFPNFNLAGCTSLEDFHLRVHGCQDYKMDFNKIILPRFIKRVKLHNVNITTTVPLVLDTLIFENYSFPFVKLAFKYFNTRKLAFDLDYNGLEYEEDLKFTLNLWEKSTVQQFAFGKIQFPCTNCFTGLNKYVNNQTGEYYLQSNNEYRLLTKKTNGKEKGIDYFRFKRLCSLNPHEEDLKLDF